MTGWLLLVMTASPTDARFVLEVGDVAVAELHVAIRGNSFIYESTQFFSENAATTSIERSLNDGTPETLELLTTPRAGCRDVVEERTGKTETLCVKKVDATSASGTIDGRKFTAKYVKGMLANITVGDAKWRRVEGTPQRSDVNPFEVGVGIPPGATRLVPAVDGARWLTTSPRAVAVDDVSRTRCLLLARSYVETHANTRVVTGLVLEDDRAFPHAWVMTRDGAVDPSVLEVNSARRYVEFPGDKAGALFLALFAGTLRLAP